MQNRPTIESSTWSVSVATEVARSCCTSPWYCLSADTPCSLCGVFGKSAEFRGQAIDDVGQSVHHGVIGLRRHGIDDETLDTSTACDRIQVLAVPDGAFGQTTDTRETHPGVGNSRQPAAQQICARESRLAHRGDRLEQALVAFQLEHEAPTKGVEFQMAGLRLEVHLLGELNLHARRFERRRYLRTRQAPAPAVPRVVFLPVPTSFPPPLRTAREWARSYGRPYLRATAVHM